MSPVTKKARREDSGDSKTTSDNCGVILFEVENVSTLNRRGRDSAEIEVGGVPWKANVTKESGSLSIFLCTMINKSKLWSIDVKAEFVLVHPDSSQNVSEHYDTDTKTFYNEAHSWGLDIFEWNDVMDEEKGFINNEKIIVEIRFSIIKMRGIRTVPQVDFTDSKDPRHDVALVIDGQKVYASKQILAFHSPVLNVMFYGEFMEKDKKEIELKEVDREEFVDMLRVIYPNQSQKITDHNVLYLLGLGDRFQIKFVLDLSEEHLISSNVPELASKLLLSDKFTLIKLQDYCLTQLKTPQEVMEMRDTPEYDDLSDATKVALFDRMCKLMRE